MPHDLLPLRESSASSLGVASPFASFPLASIASFATSDMLETEMSHELGAGVEGEGAAFPAAIVSARRRRLRSGSGSG